MSLITPVGVLSFPSLFSPRAPAQGAEPRFSCVLIFDEAAQKTPEFASLKQEVLRCANEEWGQKRPSNIRWPIRKGDEKEYAGYGPGKVFVTLWSKNRPGIVDAQRQDIIAGHEVWAGQLARCSYNPFAYSNSGNTGVSLGLNNVQIVRQDMPRLDGRKAAKDEFGEVDGGTGGAMDDDEIPF